MLGSQKSIFHGGLAVAVACAIAGLAVAAPAWAGSFAVDPVQISLTGDARTASLTIKNSDAAPVSIRAQALKWVQQDGIDHYLPTTSVITSPPIFTIPPGGTQILRVGVKDANPTQAYRLMLEEIPSQKRTPNQIDVTLRLNLPIYRIPRGGSAKVSWHAWRSPDGAITIEGHNLGTAHLQVTELLTRNNGRTDVLSKSMGVVLPGSERIWKSALNVPLESGAPFTLIIKSPSGDSQTEIPLESR